MRIRMITSFQWSCLYPFLVENFSQSKRPRLHKPRAIIEAIIYVLSSGCTWRLLPPQFPPWKTVYYYFSRLKSRLDSILRLTNVLCRCSLGRKDEPSAAILDSQSVKTATFVKEDVGFDGNKKVKGRKRHVLTDTLGLIWAVSLTAANVHDTVAGTALLQSLVGRFGIRLQKIFVDQGYRGDWANNVVWPIEVVEKAPVGQVSPKRWIVERSLGWLNHPRRLAKDFELKSSSSAAWIKWAGILIALRKIKPGAA